MKKSQKEIRSTILENLETNRWYDIREIYAVIEKNLVLEEEDFEPAGPGRTNQFRWERNVRNVLQQGKSNNKRLFDWDKKNARYLILKNTNLIEQIQEKIRITYLRLKRKINGK